MRKFAAMAALVAVTVIGGAGMAGASGDEGRPPPPTTAPPTTAPPTTQPPTTTTPPTTAPPTTQPAPPPAETPAPPAAKTPAPPVVKAPVPAPPTTVRTETCEERVDRLIGEFEQNRRALDAAVHLNGNLRGQLGQDLRDLSDLPTGVPQLEGCGCEAAATLLQGLVDELGAAKGSIDRENKGLTAQVQAITGTDIVLDDVAAPAPAGPADTSSEGDMGCWLFVALAALAGIVGHKVFTDPKVRTMASSIDKPKGALIIAGLVGIGALALAGQVIAALAIPMAIGTTLYLRSKTTA